MPKILLSELIKKGNIKDIKQMEEFIRKESRFYHKEYTYLTIPEPKKIKSSLKK